MATFTVTTLVDENDAGATVGSPGHTGLSLREAIALTNAGTGGDTINFAPNLSGTIRLANGTLSISKAVTIDGDGHILITGDVSDDDTTVGSSDVTDIVLSAATLADNVRIFSSSADLTLGGL